MSKLISSSGDCDHCGHHKCFAVYDDGEHCFSCKYTKKFKKPTENTYSLFANPELQTVTELKLPQTITDNFPKEALKVFARANLTPDLVKQFGIGYVAMECVQVLGKTYPVVIEDRIIIPTFCHNELVNYQAKAVNPDATPKVKWIGKYSPFYICAGFKNQHREPRIIIIVEDVFSAIRVWDVTQYDTVALLGTSLHDENLLTLIQAYDRIGLWLDSDQPGQSAAKKIKQRLELYGKEVVNIVTTKDPKECWIKEIGAAIQPLTSLYESQSNSKL